MLINLLRTLILYLLVVLVMRAMGKRQIGELEPFELVIAVMIAELATIPMADAGIPLINGIIPILVLLVIQLTLSSLSLKSVTARKIISGVPSIIIKNGQLVEEELYRLRYNLHEVLEQLRIKGYPNISDIEFAILETSGQLSVIPKSQKRAVTPEDLKISTPYEGIPLALIVDGYLQKERLAETKLTLQWLEAEIKKQGFNSIKEIFLASIDSNGNLYLQEKNSCKLKKQSEEGK